MKDDLVRFGVAMESNLVDGLLASHCRSAQFLGRAASVAALLCAPLASAHEIEKPIPVSEQAPEWPAGAYTGRDVVVPVLLTISAEGRVSEVEVEASLGPDFDQAAIAAALQWTFVPAHSDEVAVSAKVRAVVRFRATAPKDTVQEPAADAGFVELTVHGDHLFYDDLQSEEAVLRFQALADADANQDGDITLAELDAVPLYTVPLSNGSYGTGALGNVNTLGDYERTLSRTIGHYRGEGSCNSKEVNQP
jgi:TonB family protein